MKGVRSGLAVMIATGRVLVHGTLLRAEETAGLLAVRGYVQGGTFVPAFTQGTGDRTAVFFALCTAVIAVIPARAFFILS